MNTTLPFTSLDDLRKTGMRRECGGCTTCCFVVAVDELNKPFRSSCPHTIEGVGCGIWNGPGGPGGAPEACGAYRCAWAMGFGDEADRPDQSGVLIDFRVVSMIDVEEPPAFYAIGVRRGWEETPGAKRAMANVAKETGWSVHLADKDLNVLEVIG